MLTVHPGSDALVLGEHLPFPTPNLLMDYFEAVHVVHSCSQSITSFLPTECTQYVKYVYLSPITYLTYVHVFGIQEVIAGGIKHSCNSGITI
jgi:hypothetical protein